MKVEDGVSFPDVLPPLLFTLTIADQSRIGCQEGGNPRRYSAANRHLGGGNELEFDKPLPVFGVVEVRGGLAYAG
jgi:hypothetical protein